MKRLLWSCLTIAIIALVIITIATKHSAEREFNAALTAMAQIHAGMSEAEVDTIMGRPADYVLRYGPEYNHIDKYWLIVGHRFDLETTAAGVVKKKMTCGRLAEPTWVDRWRLLLLNVHVESGLAAL